MFEKYYVIQHRHWEDDQWTTFSTQYPTVQAAMVKLLRLDPVVILKALGYSAKDIQNLR